MTQYIAPADLTDLDETELRALLGRLLADLQRRSKFAGESLDLSASLRNVQAAIARLQQRPRPQLGPRF